MLEQVFPKFGPETEIGPVAGQESLNLETFRRLHNFPAQARGDRAGPRWRICLAFHDRLGHRALLPKVRVVEGMVFTLEHMKGLQEVRKSRRTMPSW